jgi:hypothetical protein
MLTVGKDCYSKNGTELAYAIKGGTLQTDAAATSTAPCRSSLSNSCAVANDGVNLPTVKWLRDSIGTEDFYIGIELEAVDVNGSGTAIHFLSEKGANGLTMRQMMLTIYLDGNGQSGNDTFCASRGSFKVGKCKPRRLRYPR